MLLLGSIIVAVVLMINDLIYCDEVGLMLQARLTCPGANRNSTVTWQSYDGDRLPRQSRVHNGQLVIDTVRREHEGFYVCTIMNGRNGDRNLRMKVQLVVIDFIPSLNGESFLEMESVTPSKTNDSLEIGISLKARDPDGLILYTEGKPNSENFVSIGLRDQKIVVRLNVVGKDDKIIEIESKETITLDTWHKIVIKINPDKAELIVDGRDGSEISLTTAEIGRSIRNGTVYLGGIENFNEVDTRLIGFETGIKGTISDYTVNGERIDIGASNIRISHNVHESDVCQSRPCKNNGTCVPQQSDRGYICSCDEYFMGPNCQKPSTRCRNGACMVGMCLDTGARGYKCICPMNSTGIACGSKTEIGDALKFDGMYSFTSIPKPDSIEQDFVIDFHIKPKKIEGEAILVYIGENESIDSQNFIGLKQKDSNLELYYHRNEEKQKITTKNQLKPDEWNEVSIRRSGNKIELILNGVSSAEKLENPEEKIILGTDLYVGGVWPGFEVGEYFETENSFDGSIYKIVKLNEQEISLTESQTESGDIDDSSLGENLCITPKNPCNESQTCLFDDILKNYCKSDTAMGIDNYVSFNGSSYIEIDGGLMPHLWSDREEVLEMVFQTRASDGLILWHGQSDMGAEEDHLAIHMQEGKIVFTFELGGGPVSLRSMEQVNDGQEYMLRATRKAKLGRLYINRLLQEEKEAPGLTEMINNDGNIFIGGVPEIEKATGGRHEENFVGCIKSLNLDGRIIDFSENSISFENMFLCN